MTSFARIAFLCLTLFTGLTLPATANSQTKPKFKAVAFDYFVLFNADSVIPKVEKEFPGRGEAFTMAWRNKQFSYGFLRSITDRHEDFFRVTADALDYTADSMRIKLTPEVRQRLLNAYLTLTPWEDTISALKTLKANGIKIITIANFSSRMLRANADNAGITDLFDNLLSTEGNKTYKPDPKAYELGLKTLSLQKSEIVFAAFGGWDVYGAKTFGFPTYWVNRTNVPAERLGVTPDGQSQDLSGLVKFVLGK